jgi:hypothetical protein
MEGEKLFCMVIHFSLKALQKHEELSSSRHASYTSGSVLPRGGKGANLGAAVTPDPPRTAMPYGNVTSPGSQIKGPWSGSGRVI